MVEKQTEIIKNAPTKEEIQPGDSVEFDLSGQKVQGRVVKANHTVVKIRYFDKANKSEQKISRFREDVLKVKY